MLKKVNDKRMKIIINVSVPVIVYVIYTAAVFLLPMVEDEVRKIEIIIMLAIASISDIRTQNIPLTACIAILGINVIRSVLVLFYAMSWITSFVVLVIFIAIYAINKDLIGLGDIFLAAVCVQSLMPEDIIKFLFMAFAFSSFIGFFKCLKTKSLSNITVPMSPCVAVSFLLFII